LLIPGAAIANQLQLTLAEPAEAYKAAQPTSSPS
jgi:hypothetical protein